MTSHLPESSAIDDRRQTAKPVMGVLAGRDPCAAVSLMEHVVQLTPARDDRNPIRVVVDFNPNFPSRTRSLLGNEESPSRAMLESCQRLAAWPVDAIAIASNSTCHWHGELQSKLKTPLVSMIEVTARRLKAVGDVHRAVVLSGYVPWRTQSYCKPLQQAGIEYCHLTESDQPAVQEFIEAVKVTGSIGHCDPCFKEYLSAIREKYHADGMVLAATALTALRKVKLRGGVIVDSSEALARALVDFAYHGRPLEFDVDKVRTFWAGRGRRLKDRSLGLLQAGMFTQSESEAEERWEIERREVTELLAEVIRPGDEILEPGCGTGRWTRELVRMGARVVGFDACREFIEVAREIEGGDLHPSRAAYLISDVLGFHSDRQFNGVFVSGLLQYLSDAELCRFNNLVINRTKPGGWLCIKQTVSLARRLELRGYFSETMKEEYSAVYRTEEDVLSGLVGSFRVVGARLVFSPAADKPETCQKAFLLRRFDHD